MSFRVIERKMGSGDVSATGVAFGATKSGGRIVARIRFATDILDTMNWAPGIRLGLAYGSEEDAGKLRIGPDDLNGIKLLKGRLADKSKILISGRIGDGKKHNSEIVPHKIQDGYLYIVLPDWARAAE